MALRMRIYLAVGAKHNPHWNTSILFSDFLKSLFLSEWFVTRHHTTSEPR
jgi:hypothetical protein